MSNRYLVGLSTALLGLCACGDLQVRSIPPTEAVPAALEGEWSGGWQSSENNISGALSVRIQEFDRQPVVSLTINNPCLVPRDYDLVLTGGRVALQANGVTVLEATLVDEQTLEGTYGCLADSGQWTATRLRDLPEPLDLSGTWNGSVSIGPFQQPLLLDLSQGVRNGALALDGFADLPGSLPFPLEVTGFVEFRDDEFELVLQTVAGNQPGLVLTGVGDRDPLQVPIGLVQVLSGPALPFATGVFEITRDDP